MGPNVFVWGNDAILQLFSTCGQNANANIILGQLRVVVKNTKT
jgi:hypothetical protein